MKHAPKTDSKIYVVSEIFFEYNDEYYFPVGQYPGKYSTSKEEAKNWCINETLKLCAVGDFRTTKNVGYDATFETRWKWFMEHELNEPVPNSIDVYEIWEYDDIDWDKLIMWVTMNDLDLYDYLPRLFEYTLVDVL